MPPTCYEQYQESESGLLMEYPYYYYYSSQAPYTESREIPWAAIELIPRDSSFKLLLNPDNFSRLDLPGAMFILAHEVLHVVFEHPLSVYHDHELWGLVIDMSVNSMLLAQGMKLPLDPDTGEEMGITLQGVADEVTKMWALMGTPKTIACPPPEMSAEWYLMWMLENMPEPAKSPSGKPQPGSEPGSGSGSGQKPEKSDDQGDDESDGDGNEESDAGAGDDPSDDGKSGSGKSKSGSGASKPGAGAGSGAGQPTPRDLVEQLIEQAQHDFGHLDPDERELAKQMIAEANEYAMGQAGPPGNIAGQCAALLKALKPQENWENQVKKFFGMMGGLFVSTSMWRKNKYGTTPKVMLRPTKRIVIFIDSSGSVYDHWISRFLGVVEEISKFAEVYLMWIDCKVQSFDKFDKAPRTSEGYEVKGRGGTSMRAGFRYLTEIKFQYDAAIVCSDLEFYDGYPTREELGNHKVLWVGIKGTPASHPVPPEAGAAIYIPEGELVKQ